MNYLIIYYIVINLLHLIFMGIDKRKARRGEWRISEANLWMLAFIGGACGGFLAMKMFRHKTKHPSFKYGFPFLAAIQLGIVLYFLND